jgi:Xaa-Pro aminopeptidase
MLDAKTCGYLRRPGLVLSPEDSLYLFGRPLPAALLYEREGPLARLALLAVGRSPSVGIHRMRTIKEPAEIRAIRRACAITSKAFVDIAPLIRPGATEADLERAILGSFARSGATGVAFRSVVGSGANATLPHYDRNDATLRDGFIVLDIGCSFENYASDMTRTFPVTGKYAPAQTRLMEVVAEAHEAARKTLKPGATVEDVDAAARAVIERAGFGEFFTHGIGHHVGLSVHDPHAEILQPNMVLTVEPGIYIPRGAKVAPAYRGLGVRIEDTYLITADGAEALTHFPHIP